jgi:hypothetical protein
MGVGLLRFYQQGRHQHRYRPQALTKPGPHQRPQPRQAVSWIGEKFLAAFGRALPEEVTALAEQPIEFKARIAAAATTVMDSFRIGSLSSSPGLGSRHSLSIFAMLSPQLLHRPLLFVKLLLSLRAKGVRIASIAKTTWPRRSIPGSHRVSCEANVMPDDIFALIGIRGGPRPSSSSQEETSTVFVPTAPPQR